MCPFCGTDARRGSVNRIGVSGFASTPGNQIDFSEDYRRYREAGEQFDHAFKKRENETGQSIAGPNLAAAAKARAVDMRKHGVAPDSIST